MSFVSTFHKIDHNTQVYDIYLHIFTDSYSQRPRDMITHGTLQIKILNSENQVLFIWNCFTALHHIFFVLMFLSGFFLPYTFYETLFFYLRPQDPRCYSADIKCQRSLSSPHKSLNSKSLCSNTLWQAPKSSYTVCNLFDTKLLFESIMSYFC